MESNVYYKTRNKDLDNDAAVVKGKVTYNPGNNLRPRSSIIPAPRHTQDDNWYLSKLKHVRRSETDVRTVPRNQNPGSKMHQKNSASEKPVIALSQIRNESSNVILPTLQSLIPLKSRGSVSYQVQHRQSRCNQQVIPNMMNQKREQIMHSTNFDNNSPKEAALKVLFPPRERRSMKCSVSSSEMKKIDSDDEKSSDAVCTGDYVADTEDATIDEISSYTSDEYGTELEYFGLNGSPKKDAETQTPQSRVSYLTEDMVHFDKMRTTETCELLTTTLYAKRSISDTSLARIKSPARPSTSPPHFVAQSREVCKLTTTTECCLRPSSSPAQFLAETKEFANLKRFAESSSRPRSPQSFFGTEPKEVCKQECTYCHSLQTTLNHDMKLGSLVKHNQQSDFQNQFIVPEPIKAILKPLEYKNESNPKCTMTKGKNRETPYCPIILVTG